MRRLGYILTFLFLASYFNTIIAQEKDFFGGIEVGLSTTKLNLDSIETGYTFSPALGFSFQRQLYPKFYGGISTVFTRKNAKTLSPSVSYQLTYLDWRLSLQYRVRPNLFLEGGAAISQYLLGRAKFTNGTKVDLKNDFTHQTNPYFGLRYKINNNIISAKYYLPNVLLKTGSFSPENQFSYGELTLNIPFKSKSEDKVIQQKEDRAEAEKQIKALKSGILLVALSSQTSKSVKDRELDQLLVNAFKTYQFSKYFIVDEKDLDSLRKTNRIAVYEDYPFTEKQTINLENFTWFIAAAGEQMSTESNNTEVYAMKTLTIYNSEKKKLSNPFPNRINYSEGNLTEVIQSFNAQLERFYYEVNFGL